ncbi:MAG: O-antigen ligase family protein [Chloracidobacterium sp.]|nr:O-antigen ligase family protein [Chloracidobacterium sp.]
MSSLIIEASGVGLIHQDANSSSFAQWTTRIILCGLAIFAISIPHSIAAAQIGLGLSYAAWIARALAVWRLGIPQTPIDRPLLCFVGLTIISAVLSVEPAESLPKIRALTLFFVFYLIISNVRPRAARWIIGLMIVSGLVGVGYSLMEKSLGRGMIVTAIEDNSPLRTTGLQAGDVLWMIGRRRVNSLEEANRIIREYPADATFSIEALHDGDPVLVPAPLTVTDKMKAQANPLGVSVAGRSRHFRISGFSRHFITYAEQMQIFALLAFGLLLSNLTSLRKGGSRFWLWTSLSLAGLFSLALILTASRSVIVSCMLAMLITLGLIKERRAALLAVVAVVAIGAVSACVLPSIRTANVMNLTDNSGERRVGYMKAGLRLIPSHPVFGVGMDAEKYHWKEWGFPGDYITHTHSTPIQIAVDRGLPALGAYLWLMAMLFVMIWRRYKANLDADIMSGGLLLGALAALIGFSASSLVNYNFGDSEPLLMLLSVIALSLVASSGFGAQNAQKI